MRGLKQGAPFISWADPSVTNWQSYNLLKRPGDMRLISYRRWLARIPCFPDARSIGA
ncbi:MAG: beta-galactosidase [Eisenbergiella massiliensis]